MLLELDRMDTAVAAPSFARTAALRTSTGAVLATSPTIVAEQAPEPGASPSRGRAPELSARVSSTSDGVRVLGNDRPLTALELAKYHHIEINSKIDVLQSWEGIVRFVDWDQHEFVAELTDLNHKSAELSEATFYIDDVSEDDQELLREGGVFRWVIGYRKYSYGQMERISAINFRRLPAWHEDDLEIAQREGESLAAAFSAE